MKRLKSYQEWCIDTITSILKNVALYRVSLVDQGVKYVLKAMIAHYASMYYSVDKKLPKYNNEHINVWWDQLSRKRWESVFRKLLMSKRAAVIVHNKNKRWRKERMGLHLEHIEPGEVVFEKLLNLIEQNKISSFDVKKCFLHNKLIVITKAEAHHLDGAKKTFRNEDLALVSQWYGLESCHYKEAVMRFGDRPKCGGSAVLRIARLFNCKLKFVNYDNIEQGPQEILKYLESSKNCL